MMVLLLPLLLLLLLLNLETDVVLFAAPLILASFAAPPRYAGAEDLEGAAALLHSEGRTRPNERDRRVGTVLLGNSLLVRVWTKLVR